MRKVFTILTIGLLSFSPFKVFDNTPATLPFTQNWTNPALITLNDNWSGVPSIIGYLGDGITGGTGVDPQTLLGEGIITVDVIANQANPNALATGGVAEFDGIADPVIALQGSGTADAPNIIIHLNTTGFQNINVAYNLRDIDGSIDNAIQPIALQYRLGSSGNFTNVPAGFVADATTGPNLATMVTAVNAFLPAACDNQTQVQVRIITSNAAGNDEWVGIDDINITGTPGTFNSNSSNIILNAGFAEPANIGYLLYQNANITDANSIEVAQFIVQDGGGVADGDAFGTTLTDLVMSLSNFADVRRVAIYDGITELDEVAGGASVSFSGLNLVAPDDGSKTYSVRVTFNTAVTDNNQFVFAITGATADGAGSTFATGNAGGASSSSTGDENRIEVTADRFAYVQNTTSPTGVNVAMAPAVTLRANDINANLDLDFVELVRITSAGTLVGTPVDVAAVGGVVTFNTLTHSVIGTGFTLNAERAITTDWDVVSNLFDILSASSATDYFRSQTSGPWIAAATWESSPDNLAWQPATLAPNNNANIIYIRNGHTVTINATLVTADQVIIEANGILENQATVSNAFTIANGGGDDLTIEANGRYQISSGLSFANYQTVSPGGTVRIRTGGTIQITSIAGSSHNSFAITPTTYIWETASIFDWNTTTTPGATGVTFFPDATALIIPIWRFSASPLGNLGGGSSLLVNGVLDANSNVIFTSGSDKTFRNGIFGSGNVTQIVGGAGKIIINGTVAGLGGTGVITPVNGLDIGASTTVTMISSKTVAGNVALLADSYVNLGGSNLTVSGTITGGASNSHIVTDGTGLLVLQDITTAKTFPIGPTTVNYNPVSISHAGVTPTDFSARVEVGINPSSGIFANYGVNRTWNIMADAVTPNSTISFQYESTDLNGSLTTADDLEVIQYAGVSWSIVTTPITPTGGPTTFVVTTPGTMGINDNSTPYALGKAGGYILPIDCIISCRSAKQNNAGLISWDVSTCSEVMSFEVQRAVNGSVFTTVASITPGSALSYSYTDMTLAAGTNLYRIKIRGNTGAVKYSNTVAIINDTKGLLITALSPNPVNNQASMVINAAKAGTVDFVITDITGRPLKQWKTVINEGSNTIPVNATGLATGVYHLSATSGGSSTVVRFIKQ